MFKKSKRIIALLLISTLLSANVLYAEDIVNETEIEEVVGEVSNEEETFIEEELINEEEVDTESVESEEEIEELTESLEEDILDDEINEEDNIEESEVSPEGLNEENETEETYGEEPEDDIDIIEEPETESEVESEVETKVETETETETETEIESETEVESEIETVESIIDEEPIETISTESEAIEDNLGDTLEMNMLQINTSILGALPTPNSSQQGMKVKMNDVALDIPDGETDITYDLVDVGVADGGYISLKKNASGKVTEVTIDSVVLNNFDYDPDNPDHGLEKAILFINTTEPGDYKINFKGNTSILYEENPSTFEEGFMGIVAYLKAETTLNVEGVGNANVKTRGIYIHELSGTYDNPTKVYYKNLRIDTRTFKDVAFFTYATQTFFDNVNMNVISGNEATHCFMLGVGNNYYEDDQYIARFKNCNVVATNKLTNNDRESGGLGYPSPSAFNCSYTDVKFEKSNVTLNVPHIPVGEARGVYMMSGELTIDGGSMNIKCGNDPILDLTNLIILAGIQAENVSIINNAKVNIECTVDTDRRIGAINVCDVWGIIYSRNILIENSIVNIKIDGSRPQGIYYFGPSDPIEDGTRGNVELVNSNVDIDVRGISDGYTCVGITGRRIYFNFDKGSGKTIHIVTEARDDNVNFAVCAYKFNDNCFISIPDGAYANKPVGEIDMPMHYAAPVFTFFDNSEELIEENVSREVTVRAKEANRKSHGGSGGGGSAVSAIYDDFTKLNKRIKLNKKNAWVYNEEDKSWYRADGEGYAQVGWYLDSNNKWYFLDVVSGKMMKGFQIVNGKGYYFAEVTANGKEEGDLYINEMTPLGYMTDANGELIIK